MFTSDRETGLNLIDVLSDLTRDRWYRSELIRALRYDPLNGISNLLTSAIGVREAVERRVDQPAISDLVFRVNP